MAATPQRRDVGEGVPPQIGALLDSAIAELQASIQPVAVAHATAQVLQARETLRSFEGPEPRVLASVVLAGTMSLIEDLAEALVAATPMIPKDSAMFAQFSALVDEAMHTKALLDEQGPSAASVAMRRARDALTDGTDVDGALSALNEVLRDV